MSLKETLIKANTYRQHKAESVLPAVFGHKPSFLDSPDNLIEGRRAYLEVIECFGSKANVILDSLTNN